MAGQTAFHPHASRSRPPRFPEFTAAVRYLDGRRELFRVRKADDIADARQVVLDALVDVHSVVIAERRAQDWLQAA